MTPTIAYLPGDGIGPEVLSVARRALETAGFDGEFMECAVGWSEWRRHGDALPPATLETCRSADAVLFGAITSKSATEAEPELAPHLQGTGLQYRSPILRLRQELDLYANIRPILGGPYDLTIVRENTEGLYCGIGSPAAGERFAPLGVPSDAAVDLRVVTPRGTERIIRHAFQLAEQEGRRTVTLVEKANVLRNTGGLVLDTFRRIASDFPDLATEVLHVDAACAHLVRDPERFDVVVATNLFGDILSDLAAELAGGLPGAASANIGDRHALFEPVHGSAPDIAGQGIADPTGALHAAAWMADHLGQHDVADAVRARVKGTAVAC